MQQHRNYVEAMRSLIATTILYFFAGCSHQTAFSPTLPIIPDSDKTHFVTYDSTSTLETVVQAGHSGAVRCVAMSSDGQFIASGSNDKTIKLWDVATGLEIRTLHGHIGNVYSLALSPDGKYIASADYNKDNKVYVWETLTGKLLKKLAGHFYLVHHAEFDSEYLLTAGHDARVIYWRLSSGKPVWTFAAHHAWLHPNGKEILAANATYEQKVELFLLDKKTGQVNQSIKTDLKSLQAGAFSQQGQVFTALEYKGRAVSWNAVNWNTITEFKTNDNNFACFSHDGQYVATSNQYEIQLSDVRSKKLLATIKPIAILQGIHFSTDNRFLIAGGENEMLNLYEIPSGKLIRTFSGRPDFTYQGLLIDDPNYVIGYSLRGGIVTRWNLRTAKRIRHYQPVQKNLNKSSLSGNGRYLATNEKGNGDIVIWDVTREQRVGVLTYPRKELLLIEFTPDGSKLFASYSDCTAIVWNSETLQKVQRFAGVTHVSAAAFGPNGQSVLVLTGAIYSNRSLKWYDLSTGDTIKTFGQDSWNSMVSLAFAPDGNSFFTGDAISPLIVADFVTEDGDSTGVYLVGDLERWDLATGQKLWLSRSHSGTIHSITFTHDGKRMITTSGDRTTKMWDLETNREIHTFLGHTQSVWSAGVSPDGKFMVTSGGDRKIKLWNLKTGEDVASFITIGRNEEAVITSDYYSVSKGALKHVHFADGLNVFTFDNFDLKRNRPDKIIQRLGRADSSLVRAYEWAYLKRLRRMGFTESVISGEQHLPVAKCDRSSIPLQTHERTLSLSVTASDDKFNLDRFNVYVNDVPIYGTIGIPLQKKKTKRWEQMLSIELNPGRNKIQFSAHNEKGAESLRDAVEVNFIGKDTKPDLYVLAIGVSKYTDASMDLKYASKDANDLSDFLKSQAKQFANIYIQRLLDNDVTRDNVLKCRSFFDSSKSSDYAVVFAAGHGLLDDSLNWYFASHDVDFASPSSRGISFDELEGLLDGIPARRKLLLMDACHSGEVDKEESVLVASSADRKGILTSRAFKQRGLRKKTLGLENSFELMQTLFADLHRGSGAIIIASAGGAEYAFESPEWNNGVFTYALLEGMKKKSADADKNRRIMVTELRDYVVERVSHLTQGKQHPTARKENLEFDFVIHE